MTQSGCSSHASATTASDTASTASGAGMFSANFSSAHFTIASAVRPPSYSSASVLPGAKYLMVGYPCTPNSCAVLL